MTSALESPVRVNEVYSVGEVRLHPNTGPLLRSNHQLVCTSLLTLMGGSIKSWNACPGIAVATWEFTLDLKQLSFS